MWELIRQLFCIHKFGQAKTQRDYQYCFTWEERTCEKCGKVKTTI